MAPEQRPEVYILHLATKSAQSLGLSFPSSQQLGKVPTREPGVTGWQLADDQRANLARSRRESLDPLRENKEERVESPGRVYMGE